MCRIWFEYVNLSVIYGHLEHMKTQTILDKFCQHPHSPFQRWKMVKCKLVLDESVLSTLHRGEKAQNVYRMIFFPTLVTKVVGVGIQKNLTWNEDIESLIAKVNQRIGLLNRIKHLLPLDGQVALYSALIRPLFAFADTIWEDRDNITPMDDLQILQIRLPKLSLICLTMLHLPTLSKHSDGLSYFKNALCIDTLPLLSKSTSL